MQRVRCLFSALSCALASCFARMSETLEAIGTHELASTILQEHARLSRTSLRLDNRLSDVLLFFFAYDLLWILYAVIRSRFAATLPDASAYGYFTCFLCFLHAFALARVSEKAQLIALPLFGSMDRPEAITPASYDERRRALAPIRDFPARFMVSGGITVDKALVLSVTGLVATYVLLSYDGDLTSFPGELGKCEALLEQGPARNAAQLFALTDV